MDVKDEATTHSNKNNEKVKMLVQCDQHLTNRLGADQLNLNILNRENVMLILQRK
jgi:hypothetical protein